MSIACRTRTRHLQDLHRLAPSVRQLARQKLIEKEPAVIKDEIERVEQFKYPAKEPPLDPPDIHKGGLAAILQTMMAENVLTSVGP